MTLILVLAACRSGGSPGVDGDPKRIVTLTPSATAVVAAAGGLDRIVAVDRFSDQPPAVRALPRVGDFLRPDLEAIIRLRPDLVVLDADQGGAIEALAAAGIRTLALPMHTIDDVHAALLRVGEALGTGAAAKAAAGELRRTIDEVRERASARPSPRPRVLLIVDRQRGDLGNLVAAAKGSFLDDLLVAAGGENALAGGRVRYPRLSPEQVLVARPDVILEALHGAADDTAADWRRLDIPAVERGRIHLLSDGIYHRPGPHVGEALASLETLLWGASPLETGE